MRAVVWLLLNSAAVSLSAPVTTAEIRIPPGFAGQWSGNLTTSPVGPRSAAWPGAISPWDQGINFLEVSSMDVTGTFYMRQHAFDQLFRVPADGTLQYCSLKTEATFQVMPTTGDDNELTICWRGPRLPSHAANCTGCACAKWSLMIQGDHLQSTFMMSPPAIHMQMNLTRTGPAPDPAALADKTMNGGCDISNHTGPAVPPQQIIPSKQQQQRRSGCPLFFGRSTGATTTADRRLLGGDQGSYSDCVVLNPDHGVRLAYTAAKVPCMPCDVNFTFTADTAPGEYVSIGFKEMGAAYFNFTLTRGEDIPDYWGMRTSTNWTTELSGRILVGYGDAEGAPCLRHMSASAAYVGAVDDVPDDGAFTNLAVTTANGKTSIEFTHNGKFGATTQDIHWKSQAFGVQRVMWAKGPVSGRGCTAELGYHGGVRAVAPLSFPGYGVQC